MLRRIRTTSCADRWKCDNRADGNRLTDDDTIRVRYTDEHAVFRRADRNGNADRISNADTETNIDAAPIGDADRDAYRDSISNADARHSDSDWKL